MNNTMNLLTQEDIQRAKDSLDKRIKWARENMKTIKTAYWTKISYFQIRWHGKEWRVIDTQDLGPGNYEPCELCGFPRCRYKFIIASKAQQLNDFVFGEGNDGDEPTEKLSIGDECVINYAQIPPGEERHVKKVKEMMIKEARLTSNLQTLYELEAIYQKLKEIESDKTDTYYIRYLILDIKSKILRGNPLSTRHQFIVEQLKTLLDKGFQIQTEETEKKITTARSLLEYKDPIRALLLWRPVGQYVPTISIELAEKIIQNPNALNSLIKKGRGDE